MCLQRKKQKRYIQAWYVGIRKGVFSFIQGVPIFCKNIISNFTMIMLLTFKDTETTRVTDTILLIDRAKFSLYERRLRVKKGLH